MQRFARSMPMGRFPPSVESIDLLVGIGGYTAWPSRGMNAAHFDAANERAQMPCHFTLLARCSLAEIGNKGQVLQVSFSDLCR